MTAAPLLAVDRLSLVFTGEESRVHALDGVSFAIAPGETLGLVGESGCGKSVTALTVMRLLPRNAAVTAGAVRFQGQDLLALDERAMRAIRGNRIGMIFQEPMTSLNPLHPIGAQIAETVRIHQHLGRAAALARAEEMLGLVRIPDARRRLGDYPHQFSGGMRQRVMIAMAMACGPQLLIADEPTTALDVTIQAQILDLMLDLKERLGAAIFLITHDLAVVAETCQRVVVVYAGRVVEEAPVEALFDAPAHPYTRGLMAAMPHGAARRRRRLPEIPGMVPNLALPVVGCAFAPRCPLAVPACTAAPPPLVEVAPGHRAACIRAGAA